MMRIGWVMTPLAWGQEHLRVETYNVGLAHGFVDAAEARTPALVDALSTERVDVLCLQEVWRDDDRARFEDALSPAYPSSWALPVTQKRADRSPACRRKELFGADRFVSCLTGDCEGLKGDALTTCVVDQCGPILRDLRDDNPQCANAIMAQVGKPAWKGLWTVIRPIRKANVYAYEGSDGLMIFSQRPLDNAGEVDFTDIATLNRRRALFADVTLSEETVRIYCTHLSANLDQTAPYPGPFESWEEENLHQALRLIEHAQDFDGPVIIAGDFNTGPAGPGLTEELPRSHAALVAARLMDPAQDVGECTFCADNDLTSDQTSDKLIDHIYIRELSAANGARTRDEAITLADGSQTHLSDHFGYAVTITLPTEPPPQEEAPTPETQE
ncbi:MAG: endonuclease/exonuclease/phosphatase family protein [Myxococcota bacterium]